MKKMRF